MTTAPVRAHFAGLEHYFAFEPQAGRNLKPESFNAAMESTKLPMDALGNPAIAITATNRLSNDKVRVSQIVDGKWVAVSEYLGSPFKH